MVYLQNRLIVASLYPDEPAVAEVKALEAEMDTEEDAMNFDIRRFPVDSVAGTVGGDDERTTIYWITDGSNKVVVMNQSDEAP